MATKKFVSKDNLSRVWTRLFGKVLNSKEEIEANTSENMIAGAEAVKEVYSSLQDQPTFEYDETGKITGYKTKVGADTVFPFKNGATYIETLAADFINNNVYLTRGIFDINGIGDQHLITASGNWSGGGYHCYFTISDKATYKSRESGEVADYLYSGIRTICIACM